ncbi:MAG TPA: non-homologous end-joining DNA ligase [Micromonosporaceae bacterium]|jgi:bifunctional non-homologous end joining protein LigD
MTITHPDKQLFGEAQISKQDLADYYRAVAPAMLPHLRGRPLALERFPDGIDGDGFMQKQLAASAPAFVHHRTVPRVGGGEVTMIVCDNARTLDYLANQAALTLHPWLSRGRNLHRPDRLIFDLDPSDDDFDTVRATAHELHGILERLGLAGYPMVTGSRGIHVTVPIAAREDFDDVRSFALDVANVLVARDPDRLTTQVRKAERGGRLFVDTLRNAYGQHAVAPYSVRPLPDAPVATPLDWSEVDDRHLSARQFTVRDIPDRLAHGDPWHGIGRRAGGLSRARTRLASLDT